VLGWADEASQLAEMALLPATRAWRAAAYLLVVGMLSTPAKNGAILAGVGRGQ